MNNFEQNANFYDDLAQIAQKLALIAENRLPVTPLERDLTLQLLRDAYLNVLQCTHATAEPAPEPDPVRVAEPAPVPQPEPVKVVAPEPEPEPEPVRVVKIEPQPEPIKMVQPEPEPEPVRMVEPEPVPQPAPQPEPVKVVEPEPQPVPDILSYLEVEEPVAEPVAEPEPIREPEPEPIHPTPAPVIKEEPAPAELFAEEPAPAPQPKRSLNDLLGKEDNSLASQFQHSHIDDLSKAISLNDKFLYIKELFKGKGEDFSKAIQKLNVCPNIDEAFQTIDMLKKYYAWDTDSSAYLALCDLVRRKFV